MDGAKIRDNLKIDDLKVDEAPLAVGICDLCRLDRNQYRFLIGAGVACYCHHNQTGGFLSPLATLLEDIPLRWTLHTPISQGDFNLLCEETELRVVVQRSQNKIGNS